MPKSWLIPKQVDSESNLNLADVYVGNLTELKIHNGNPYEFAHPVWVLLGTCKICRKQNVIPSTPKKCILTFGVETKD